MAQAADENQVSQNLRERFELAAATSQPLVTAKRQCLKRSASELHSDGDAAQHQEPAPKRSRIGAWLGMVLGAGCNVLRMVTKPSTVKTSYREASSTAAHDHTRVSLEVASAADAGPFSMKAAQRAGVASIAAPGRTPASVEVASTADGAPFSTKASAQRAKVASIAVPRCIPASLEVARATEGAPYSMKASAQRAEVRAEVASTAVEVARAADDTSPSMKVTAQHAKAASVAATRCTPPSVEVASAANGTPSSMQATVQHAGIASMAAPDRTPASPEVASAADSAPFSMQATAQRAEVSSTAAPDRTPASAEVASAVDSAPFSMKGAAQRAELASIAAPDRTPASVEVASTADGKPFSMKGTAEREVCSGTQDDIRGYSFKVGNCRAPLGPVMSFGPSVNDQGDQLSHCRQPRQAGKANQPSQAYQSKSVMADPLGKPELATGHIATVQGKNFESFLHLHPEQKIIFCSVVAGTSTNRTLSMTNVSSNYVAFKIKTTSPQSLLAHPGLGVIGPSQQKDICLTYQQENAGGSSNPRYMIQMASVSNGELLSYDTWKTLSKNQVLERQLRVEIADPGTLILAEPAGGALCFSSEMGKAGTMGSTLMLTNLSGTHVAFKMKTNNHGTRMTPSCGTLGPDQQVQIHCRLEDESPWERVPSFLMQAVAVGTASPLDSKQWLSFRRESIQECRWKAVVKGPA